MSLSKSPVVIKTKELVFEAYDEALSANWLSDPEATDIIDSVIGSTAILAVEITLAHLREAASPDERILLQQLRTMAGI